MSVASWSDASWTRAGASRLYGGAAARGSTKAVTSPLAFTPLSARAVLERRGVACDDVAVGSGRVLAPPTECELPAIVTGSVQRGGQAPLRETYLPIEPAQIDSLEALLGWTIACAEASSAFLLDAQGFIVDRSGEWPYELAEATGTQVLLAFERLGKSELQASAPRSMVVEFEDHWLTSIPVPAGHGEIYTLCVVTAGALSTGRIGHIGSAVATVILQV